MDFPLKCLQNNQFHITLFSDEENTAVVVPCCECFQTVCSSAPWLRVSCFADDKKKEMLRRLFHVRFSKTLPPGSQPITSFLLNSRGWRSTDECSRPPGEQTDEENTDRSQRSTGQQKTCLQRTSPSWVLMSPRLTLTMCCYFWH